MVRGGEDIYILIDIDIYISHCANIHISKLETEKSII